MWEFNADRDKKERNPSWHEKQKKRKKKKALAGIQCLLCTKALTKQELKIALNELNGLNDSEKAKSGNMTKGKHIRGKETWQNRKGNI